jgi:hypothetical protein
MNSGSTRHRLVRTAMTGAVVLAIACGVALPASAAIWMERATAQNQQGSISVGTDGCFGIAATTYSLTKVYHLSNSNCDQRRVRWYGYQPGLGTNGFTSYSYGGPGGEITSQSHGGFAVTGYGALKD